jgi:tetratricopeptide (TPR) repeat protein
MFLGIFIQFISRWRPRARWGLIALLGLFNWHVQAHELAELDDAAGRLQYAYYSADVRAVRSGLDAIARLSLPASLHTMREYQLGIGYWRLADLLQVQGGSPLNQALTRCEEHLKSALAADARLAEAHAVQGLCDSYRAHLRKTTARSPQRPCSHHAALEKALELAPHNPRVLYVQAACAMHDGDTGAALKQAELAWQAFEHATPSTDQHSDWGQADTCLLLARLHLRQGNRTVARDRVEQALIAAPDYVAARALLAEIAATR